MKHLIRKEYSSETKAKKDRVLTVRISTSNPDRSKDVVIPSGVKLDNYLRNPVVALSHKYDELAIAKTESIQVTDDGIMATLRFPDKGVYSVADTVYELYKEGFMSAWSIGFIPTEVEDIEGGGKLFKEWELLEYSAVLVPDNPEALTLIRGKSIDTKEYEDILNNKEEVKNKVVDLSKLFKQDVPFTDPPKEELPVPLKPEGEEVVPESPQTEENVPAESSVNGELKPEPEIEPEKPPITEPESTPPVPVTAEVEKVEEKPFANEHACRLKNPDDFQGDSFRRTTREHNGKEYSVIMAKLKGEDTMTEQAYRYAKDIWSSSEAKNHCNSHDGISFEPASEQEALMTEIEVKSKHLITGKSKKLIISVIDQIQLLQLTLKGLLEMTISEEGETDKENHKLVVGLVDGLRLADQIVGKALRNYKAMAELGREPDDSLVPSGGRRGE